MRKVVARKLEFDSASIRRDHHLSHEIEKFRLAIGRETHNLVLVAIFGEAEILCERRVSQPQRMRKGNCTKGFDSISAANTPHRARKVSETIDREERRFVEG